MAEAFFRIFDEDNSGALNFYEFMQVKNAPNLESPKEKLNWIFIAFDRDGGGTIDVDEVKDIVVALFKMSGRDMGDIHLENEIEECVDEIIEAVDSDGDGEITKEEFVENAMLSKFLSKLISDIK